MYYEHQVVNQKETKRLNSKNIYSCRSGLMYDFVLYQGSTVEIEPKFMTFDKSVFRMHITDFKLNILLRLDMFHLRDTGLSYRNIAGRECS